MSQSMGWKEDLIFACAPLGIITAMVGAIRVGGPGPLKAIIGRARESRGVVEAELMSSTSADVCELWDGQGVVRVLGSSPVIEFYYLPSDLGDAMDDDAMDDDAIPLMARDGGVGIWDFESAVSGHLLRSRSSSESDNSPPLEGLSAHEVVPNIGLNLGGRRVSGLELMLAAVTGVVLQAGVVVFAGVGVYLPPWNEKFEKGGKPIPKHAFPSMAGGTVALVIGMFLCCHIVERSTTEDTWVTTEQDGHRVKVAWLQKGGKVNDQHFKSYILHRPKPKSSKFWNAMPKFLKSPSNSGTGFLIRTSRKETKTHRGYLTMLAVAVSLTGFILQFIGLRALSWRVTIAQLVATGAMTGLRAALRRNLIHEPEDKEIKVSGYELEAMAMEVSGCKNWDVTTWKPSPDGGQVATESSPESEPNAPADESGAAPRRSRFASTVADARRLLGALSMWPSECQMTAEMVAQAIEASMEFLWTNPDVHLSNARAADEFGWKLFVELSKTQGGEGSSTDTCVQLRVSRKTLPNGAWGPWKAVKSEIEAFLGLWIYSLKLEMEPGSPPRNRRSRWMEEERAMEISKNYRIVGNGDSSNKAVYKKWLLPQTELVSTVERTIGRPNPHRAECLAVFSETPLERICGQHIFSTFLADVVHRAVGSITGKVLVRGSEQGTRDSLGLRSTVIEGLLNEVERTGLATPEDALLIIVPALGKKYLTGAATTESFSDLAKEISTYLGDRRFERAEELLLWLLDTTESDAKHHEGERRWREACKAYILLLKTYTEIESKSYARRTEEAIELFFERYHSSHKTDDEEATRKTLDLVEQVSREMQISSVGEVGQRWEGRRKRREQGWGPAPALTANERLRRAAASGDYYGLMRELEQEEADIDINSHDSMERTSLMLACHSGHANITIQLLRRNADPCLKDKYGRTAIHYAARRNEPSALHSLLLHEKACAVINAVDRGGESPLQQAIQSDAGAAVALLIFYGAEDPEGSAKELLKFSAQWGSYAAVKEMLDKNSQDGRFERTSLHWAVWRGEAAVMESLLRNKVEVEAKGKDGYTALHLAARSGCDSAVEFLIRQLRAERNAESGDGKTALQLAIAGGHNSTVDLLIRQLGTEMDAEGKDGRNALHFACAGGHSSAVELLIRELGAEVNAESGDGKMALHFACAGGHDSAVELLIRELGAEVSAESGDGKTALQLAIAGGHDSTVELLVRQLGAEVSAENRDGRNALHFACAGGYDSAVELLIRELGADMNAESRDGRNALRFAIAGGHDSTLELLIRQLGAEVNAEGKDGRNALHFACAGGHDSAVGLLIRELGADMNAESRDGRNALRLAIAGGHDSTVELLIRHFGTEVNTEGKDGRNALHFACAGGHDSAVELLIRKLGADMNAESRDGRNALQLAIAGGHNSTVELLIRQLGAEASAENREGKNALHFACAGGHDSAVELLIRELGADINAKSRDGRNALHFACASGHDSTVELLIQQLGADVNAETEGGKTALHLACAGGRDSTIQLLIRRFKAEISRGHSHETALCLLVRYM